VVVLAVVATAAGLLWRGGERTEFTTVRGEAVELDGGGLYRRDSVWRASSNRGTDAVTLVLGVPLLVLGTVRYARGSRRGGLLLVGMLTWFLYLYASLALGTALNELFLVYVALFSASLYGGLLAAGSVDLRALATHFPVGRTRRRVGLFMLACGVLTAAVWGAPLLGSVLSGDPPRVLDSSTTMVTDALDLAIITPACVLAGVLLLRGDSDGYAVAFPLLALLSFLGPVIVAQTVAQVLADVSYSAGELVGPLAGFLTFAAIAVVVLVVLVRPLPRS
jgi:hypothetical protein